MKSIKFSEDYEKLPKGWEGTQATLIGVYPENISNLEKKYTAFLKYDTRYRGKKDFYKLNFEHAIILIFIHHNSGIPFTTIRRSHEQKSKYYRLSIGETFILRRD